MINERRRAKKYVALIWATSCVMVCMLFGWCLNAHAEPLAPPALATETPSELTQTASYATHLVWAARACYLEGGWSEADCIALLWVARKQARRVGKPWLDVLRRYSAIEARNARAREVRAYPWGDVPDKPGSFNRRWEQLRNLVTAVANGQRADPCPRAVHWGGPMDHARGRMVPARCAISTANTFYALRR